MERQQSPARGELCPQRQRCPSLPSPGHSCVWCLFWTLPNHGTCHTHPESSDLPSRAQGSPLPDTTSHSPKTSERGGPHPQPAAPPACPAGTTDGGMVGGKQTWFRGAACLKKSPPAPTRTNAHRFNRYTEQSGRRAFEARLWPSGEIALKTRAVWPSLLSFKGKANPFRGQGPPHG